MRRCRALSAAALGLALGLGGCGPRPPAAPALTLPARADTTAATFSAAQAGDYAIDPARSTLAVLVRRGGALARLGHDHVVSHPALQGRLRLPADPASAAEGEITLALQGLVVDDPALRARYALDTQPSAAAIEGTRANMLQRVLQADDFPWVRVRLQAPVRPAVPVQAEITLHGVTRRQSVAVDWGVDGEGLHARGRLALLQSDFGIEPLSVMAGALRVEDRLDVEFELRARPVVPR